MCLQVFSLLSLYMTGAWTPFHDLILAALSLVEALLLPLVIFCGDESFRDAINKSCACHRQQSNKISCQPPHSVSLAFTDRNLMMPAYLKSPPVPILDKPSRPNSLALQQYQSEIDLAKRGENESTLPTFINFSV